MRHIRRLNHRQLAFARAIAEGKGDREAQVAAGYLPNRKHKNEMLNDQRIAIEIDRLRSLIDAEWARRQCDERILDDPRVRAELDRRVFLIVAELEARQRGSQETP